MSTDMDDLEKRTADFLKRSIAFLESEDDDEKTDAELREERGELVAELRAVMDDEDADPADRQRAKKILKALGADAKPGDPAVTKAFARLLGNPMARGIGLQKRTLRGAR